MQIDRTNSESHLRSKSYSPFPGWIRISNEIKDENEKGPYDGLYATIENGKLKFAVFKQIRVLGGVLTGDVIGEGVGGALLSKLYSALGVDAGMYSKVNLVHVANRNKTQEFDQDTTGEYIYLQSIFVQDYQEEFWKYAYREGFRKKYLKEMQIADKKFLIANYKTILLKYYRHEMKKYSDLVEEAKHHLEEFQKPEIKNKKIDIDTDLAVFNECIKEYEKQISAIRAIFPNEINETSITEYVKSKLQNDKENLAVEVAQAKINQIECPAGVLDSDARAIISETIKNNPTFMSDFAKLVAPRILVGDFGVHCGNFGVKQVVKSNGTKEMHLVAMNYNSACNNLVSNVDPFQAFDTRDPDCFTQATGLGLEATDKNYFLEYSNDVRSSLEMAKAFSELGRIESKEIKKMIREAINEQLFYDGEKREKCKYGIDVLKEFCTRIGINYA